jgi:hypothetical protein
MGQGGAFWSGETNEVGDDLGYRFAQHFCSSTIILSVSVVAYPRERGERQTPHLG